MFGEATMILYFLVLAFLLFSSIFLFWKRIITNKNTLIPPGPPCLPFIGNLLQFDSATPHQYLWRLANKYGPIISMKLGSIPVLVITSPKMAKEVLKTHDLSFCSRPKFLAQQKLSYNGLDIGLAPYSEYWREMKKICVVHLLSSKQVQSFAPVREDEVRGMIRKISDFASLYDNDPIDLSKIVLSFTSRLLCRTAFGKKFDDREGDEEKKFHDLMHEAQAMLGGFFVADYFPLFGWVDKLSGMASRLEKTFEDLDSFYQELIDEHLIKPKGSNSTNKDILDLLIELMEEEESGLVKLTPDHIKGVLMNILLGGADSSAATIIWAMTALIKAPRAMNKAQEEIRVLIGNKGRVEVDDLGKLRYLRAVIKETLRLNPPAPLLVPRETMQKCIIEGYEIQPKTLVYVNAWAIGRDPEYWENPMEFWPERFLNGNQVDIKGQDFELIPFGAGRRRCPGISMGLAKVELGLANLLYSFDWDLPCGLEAQDIDIDVLPGITMHKKNALRLVPKKLRLEKV